jgi:hypothetical protein
MDSGYWVAKYLRGDKPGYYCDEYDEGRRVK